MTKANGVREMPSQEMPLQPEQWVERYGDYLYRYAAARVADAETAQDLVQETLVAAIQSHGRFEGRSSVKTWLVAILKRKIVDYYRRKKNRPETDLETVEADLFDDQGHWRDTPAIWDMSPDAAYEQKEFIGILYRCLSTLPARLAEIFMMREFDDLGTEAICKSLNITESNSWVMLFRARMQLKKCLERLWGTGNRED